MLREGDLQRAIRILLRLVISVCSISVLIVLLGGSFWYVWESAHDRAPQVGYEITARKLERAALGLYIRLYERWRGVSVDMPADADNKIQTTFVIEYGEPVVVVAYHLERMGLVRDAELFRRLVQYYGADLDIQAGVYTLSPSMTMAEIMNELRHGRMPARIVTIPEGWRIEQIAERLEAADIVPANVFLQAAMRRRNDYTFLRDWPEGSPNSLEGFLFPDTYQLPIVMKIEVDPNTGESSYIIDPVPTAERIVDVMLLNWDRRIPDSWRVKAADRQMSLYEVVTLASIVEREAVHDDERPLIAGVYLNRLERGMYLQADPTVQYAKGKDPQTGQWWSPMAQEEAITVISSYNTFLNPGLPPGPICNPGVSSIRAVLEPQVSKYLFFYSKGDGYHVFAETYEEHLRNEQIYGEQR